MREELMRQKLMLLDLKKLQKKADKKFQLLRRLQARIGNGVVKCISCGSLGDYKKYDGGHFIPRHHLGVRYEPDNVWPQCKKCNKWLSGNHAKYRENLITKIGKERVERLEEKKDKVPSCGFRQLCIDVFIDSKNKVSEYHEN